MEIKSILRSCLVVLLLFPAIALGDAGTGAVADKTRMLNGERVTINDSIRWALEYSPRLKTLQYNYEALDHELDQAKGDYFPSLDLSGSYGFDQHSDLITRRPDADPSDDQWDTRAEVGLILQQLLYDGGAVSSRVGIQQAKLNSSEHRVTDNIESIALDAVITHLSVFRQRRLMTLAENNISDHEEILAHLIKRKKGGAGNSADVSQAQGRLSRAKASSYKLKADLIASISNYKRVVGRLPEDLQFANIPNSTPVKLDDALAMAVKGNPKILAFGADITEYESRLELARSAYFPKFFLELSKLYQDQVEGDPSWQDTDVAIVKMNWNLFNGGSDISGKHAARSRIRQSMEILQNEILKITEETQNTWALYESIIEKIKVFKDAASYSSMTLDAYLKQFTVSQRSLLDVLSAENELFQSSGLLVTDQVNELIAAGRILALSGKLVDAIFPDADLPEPAPRKEKIVSHYSKVQ